MMRLILDIDESSEAGRYFIACARIRDISVRGLQRRLFEALTQDQLIASVLDDGDNLRDRRKREHRFHRRRSPQAAPSLEVR